MSKAICILLGVVCLASAASAGAAERPFALFDKNVAAKIAVDESDWKGVVRAAGDLAEDIGRVTGTKAEVPLSTTGELPAKSVVVGTIGKSRLIDGLIAAGKIDVAEVRGQWEASHPQAWRRYTVLRQKASANARKSCLPATRSFPITTTISLPAESGRT